LQIVDDVVGEDKKGSVTIAGSDQKLVPSRARLHVFVDSDPVFQMSPTFSECLNATNNLTILNSADTYQKQSQLTFKNV